MVITGTSPLSPRVYPKWTGAAAMVLVGALAAPVAVVVICAAIMAGLATLMVLVGPEHM
jgi:hypothetical protein